MSLANLLSVEQIIPEMKATERWAAIVELIDLLVSLGKIKTEDRDPILWWIDGDQLYDSVRNEPRFQALVQKIDRAKAESKK